MLAGEASVIERPGKLMTTLERQTVVVPADWIPGPTQGNWTYAKYAAIPDDGHRYEVVRGVLYMSPSPNVEHQRIAGRIFELLSRFVEAHGLGEAFISPLDVEPSPGDIVQPDIFVLLHEHLDRVSLTRIIGAPDLVIEIASPATARHDLSAKWDAYARAGVPEYWVVTPGSRTVEVLLLEKGGYRSCGLFSEKMTLPSQVLPGLPVSAEQFFPRQRPFQIS
jgi:Uma2 family endonuclease